MRKLIIVALLGLALSAQAQREPITGFSFANPIPDVRFDHDAVELQRALYPVYYARNNARGDLQWADTKDTLLEAFWNEQQDTVLHVLTELAGIPWREQSFDIYILRYFPSIGSSDPLVIPIGGMRRGDLIEAAPSGNTMKLNLIFQLARRMLDQAGEGGAQPGLAYHPLMRAGAYRRDNLALLLAIATAERVLGPDSTAAGWRSAFWQQHFPAMEVFERYFAGSWKISPEQTLASLVLREPPTSALVAATRPPRLDRTAAERPRAYVEGLPLQGELGMAVSIDENGLLEVVAIDTLRTAFAGGLREGDRIRTVNGARAQNHRQLVEKVLASIDQGGATLQVMRDGGMRTVVLRPVSSAGPEDVEEPSPDTSR